MQAHAPYLVAVVEDDAGLRADLAEFLALRGFAVHGFDSAEAFFQAWPALHIDLLLLDVGLPGANGLDVAQRVHAEGSAGIVMLTAFDTNGDHVSGLSAGADMFLSKRSSLEVIEAACRSVLRRLERPDGDRPKATGPGAWRLDSKRWRLESPEGKAFQLTHTEVLLLMALCEKPGQPVARETLLARLGKPETISNLRNLDNAASRLRRKVQQVCGVELPVRPSYGRGYIFSGTCEVDA
jgi:DNA-binding response OmpR family regulator